MPDRIGNITVPEVVPSATFPIVTDYLYGRASHPDVAIHQFGSGNAKSSSGSCWAPAPSGSPCAARG